MKGAKWASLAFCSYQKFLCPPCPDFGPHCQLEVWTMPARDLLADLFTCSNFSFLVCKMAGWCVIAAWYWDFLHGNKALLCHVSLRAVRSGPPWIPSYRAAHKSDKYKCSIVLFFFRLELHTLMWNRNKHGLLVGICHIPHTAVVVAENLSYKCNAVTCRPVQKGVLWHVGYKAFLLN